MNKKPTLILQPQAQAYHIGEFPPQGQIFPIKIPGGRALDEPGVNAVQTLLQACVLNHKADLAPDKILPPTWSWKWMVGGKGEYIGTLPKRLAKYLWQTHKVRLSDEEVRDLGALAMRYTHDPITYYIDFTRDLNWVSGDFGDEGSCYFSYCKSARELLSAQGSYALRFWDHRTLRGLGRVWVLPQDKVWFIHNAYGIANPGAKKRLSVLLAARVLSLFWGNACYKYTRLDHGVEGPGGLYINSGAGVIVGEQEQVLDHNFPALALAPRQVQARNPRN